MREMRFRAWDTETHRMFTNCLNLMIDYRGTPYWQFGFDEPKPMSDTVLMQFTGLKDKNGREIYEGDILHVNNYSDWIVERRDAGFWIYNQCNPGVYFPLVDSDREVIGNIYENPELLK